MKIAQVVLRHPVDVAQALAPLQAIEPQWLLVFGAGAWLHGLQPVLAERFAQAKRLGCSTAGEISGQGVSEQTCVVTAMHFDQVQVHAAHTVLSDMTDSFAAGQRLAQALPAAGLRAVWVLGQGVNINGSALIGGLAAGLDAAVLITGGLAGDDAQFKQTWVMDDTGVHADHVACVGLYGQGLHVSHGSFGGWMPFGPARKVTRCNHNVLFELDGEPALDVYKRYLGEHAKDLPASGLLFPFSMLGQDQSDAGLIRTILAVDEAAGSLTLAGDIDPAGYLRLMHASTDALVDGAESAAQAAKWAQVQLGQSLALLVSCVGRKLVMGGRVEEEVEVVAEALGQTSVQAGFYSYGEISPMTGESACKLHNQTMTITHVMEFAATAADNAA
ncbi:FIST N-terminal domain-containing protein [Rhodoferax sp.]|uniref:FIST signal transduction protein n=1 Tax=Rhodoferax sp. TaxID=50421 RepID=UPI0026275370|nr:FIST N-terminal domain-containing protein [Rhodoferax sp.]MDD2811705.1 FIST N-terminal domain-containing protein [Rhodoferax sp.]